MEKTEFVHCYLMDDAAAFRAGNANAIATDNLAGLQRDEVRGIDGTRRDAHHHLLGSGFRDGPGDDLERAQGILLVVPILDYRFTRHDFRRQSSPHCQRRTNQ